MKAVQRIIIIITNIIFIITIALVLYSLFQPRPDWEAYIGKFGTTDFSGSWILTGDGESREVVLPVSVADSYQKILQITNTLPDTVADGMRLCLRSDMEDVEVWIDGELRSSYGSDTLEYVGYYPPSAYLFVDLQDGDAGKEISIEYTVKKTMGKISTISIGYGNNAWFAILTDHMTGFVSAVLMILVGIFAILFYYLFKWKFSADRAVFYLGQTIMIFGIWSISESKLRQIFLHVPTLSNIFCYLSVEIIAVFVLLYFDKIMQQKYHKLFLALEGLCLGQLLINILLSVTGVMEFHNSLKFAHVWIILATVCVCWLLGRDIKTGQIRRYKVTAIGMLVFLFFTVLEIVSFYYAGSNSLGAFLSVGFILMLIATILQNLVDVYYKEIQSREHQEQATLATIETIASSIDAKDEYTGGHSERVAYYASVLAEKVAAEYHLDEKKLLRIHYIALMHDIGKIAVPDSILNKAGKLTEDEYMLIKKHVTIGDTLLKDISTLEGLSDGIRHHHERYDGKGYPDGLAGEEIPLIARILCLADCFDAMTSNRVYRTRLNDQQVRNEIRRCAGTQFDPHLAKVFCELIDSGELAVQTQNGYETNDEGEVLKSSLLRHLLIHDLHDSGKKHEILYPSFVRMIAYIVKMSEKQEQEVVVCLLELTPQGGRDWKEEELPQVAQWLKEESAAVIQPGDISVQYSASKQILVCYRTQPEELLDKVKQQGGRKKAKYQVRAQMVEESLL